MAGEIKNLKKLTSRNFSKKLGDFRLSISSLARTTTFKVAFSFAGLFSTFSLILLGYIWLTTVGVLSFEADKTSRKQLSELSEIWSNKGIMALNAAVIERAATNSDDLFLLLTPDGQVLSSNIDAVPLDLSKVSRPKAGTKLKDVSLIATGFTYYRGDNVMQKRAARGVFLAGADGYGLFVARDLGAGYVLAERVVNAVWTGTMAVLAFAVVGGYFAARGASRRVDELSKTTKSVMAGNLSMRAPVYDYKTGEGDEFDVLTNDLNAMLERVEKLVQSSRTIGDAIAHDLRSPLTRLRVNLEAAIIDNKSKPELDEIIENTIAQLDRIVATFNGVLRLSRLEAGQGGNFEICNLSEILEEISELFEPSISDKGLGFEFNIGQKLTANIDKAMFIQAITNILDNAIKYTNSGKIIFSAYENKKQIIINIEDTGIGIAPDKRSEAVKRFVRLDNARTEQGSGIGLSLAQAIIEAHKGKLELLDGLKYDGGMGLKTQISLPK